MNPAAPALVDQSTGGRRVSEGNAGPVDHEDIIEEYGSWMRGWNASERTIKARQVLARSRLKAWGLEGMTADNVATFLSRPKLSKWTRATYHSHLTDFCAWLAAKGHIAQSPMPDVRSPMRPHSRPRPLTEGEVTRVLEAAQGRTRDWVLLALHAGLRTSEVAALRGEDVDPDGIYVLGKGETMVTLPCHSDLWTMAKRYPRHGFWFPGNEDGHVRSQRVSLVVGKLFEDLGIYGSLHRVRHVYGTRLLRSGVNVRVVQQLMRHAHLNTTAGYTAVNEDELRAAIDLLPHAPDTAVNDELRAAINLLGPVA